MAPTLKAMTRDAMPVLRDLQWFGVQIEAVRDVVDALRGKRMVASPIADTLKCVISAHSAQHEKNEFETDNALRDLDNGERTPRRRATQWISAANPRNALTFKVVPAASTSSSR